MSLKKGNLSINSQNIFPIIKKWLYSEHDIFIREIISNASDAISKLKSLAAVREADLKDNKDFKIIVEYDDNEKTIKVSDNGIGMTAEEIDKYINQIAFSGAEEFVEKFKDKDSKEQIIGHFGLGFYSAFMVSSLVTIDTLSYKDGAEAAFWSCDGSSEFEIKPSDRKTRGTTVTIHLNEDGNDFRNGYKIKNTIKKYCNFMPYDIYFDDLLEDEKESIKAKERVQELEKKIADFDTSSEDSQKELESLNLELTQAKADLNKEKTPVNNKYPLYLKSPSECSEDEYREFYRELFVDFKEPLFWIHLNMDYPFRLKGILYFPKLNTEFDGIEGQIKLYNSQVYVADNIKEVIPEFLLLLKGIIDCPDLPLNVSRSFLQNDGFVTKISEYIVRKVADKLNGLFKTEREEYQKYWSDINPFVKFGTLRDEKFYDRVKESLIYASTSDKYYTLNEYSESMKEKIESNVYYTDDMKSQAQYIKVLEKNGIEILKLDERIDNAFISMIESKNSPLVFKRVDSDLTDILNEDEDEVDFELNDEVKDSIIKRFGEDKIEIELKNLKNSDIASMIIESEQSRRMNDMMKMYQMAGLQEMPKQLKIVLNNTNPMVSKLLSLDENEADKKELLTNQIVDLAKLSNMSLSADEMSDFINRTAELTLKGLKS